MGLLAMTFPLAKVAFCLNLLSAPEDKSQKGERMLLFETDDAIPDKWRRCHLRQTSVFRQCCE